MQYGVYVNHPSDITKCGYLRADGTVSPWRPPAATFPTVQAASAEIVRRGYTLSDSVMLGRMTAYPCAL